jgi:excisionase family DNA binding protein
LDEQFKARFVWFNLMLRGQDSFASSRPGETFVDIQRDCLRRPTASDAGRIGNQSGRHRDACCIYFAYFVYFTQITMNADALTTPTETDTAVARALLQALMRMRGRKDVSATIQGRKVRFPAAMVPALIEAAKLISEGHAIDVIPADDEVSAQEAADLLKVSRPYLLNLVKKGVLPYRMVGVHHRIPMGAVIAYKKEQAPRRRSLEALTTETQDLGH